MSLNLVPLPTALVQDPRLKMNSEKVYAILKGANTNTYQVFPASNVSSSGFTVKTDPSNKITLTSRLFLVYTTWTSTITGTAPVGVPLLQAGFYGPRAYPFASVVASQSVQLNNDNLVQANFFEYINALQWFHNSFDEKNGLYSVTASMLDQYNTYAAGAGSNRNPLGSYGDSCSNSDIPRGAYWGMSVLSNPVGAGATPVSAQIALTVCEPVLMSPCAWGPKADTANAFVLLNNITYQVTFRDLQNLLSLDVNQGSSPANTTVITNVVTVCDSASVILNFFDPDLSISPIPPIMIYPYFSLTNYQSPAQVMTSSATEPQVFQMTSTSLSNFPRRIYLFVTIRDQDKSAFTTDTYFPLQNVGPTGAPANPIVISWGNDQLLSTSTSFDLYEMSIKNGYKGSFTQWNTYTGSIVCLDVGTDLAFQNPLFAPGQNNKINITVRMSVLNNTGGTPSCVLNMLVVDEGCLNFTNGNVSHKIGVLSESDVLLARQNPQISYQKVENVYGGSFWSDVWNGLKSVGKSAVSSGLDVVGESFGMPGRYARKAVKKLTGYGGVGVYGSMPKKKKRAGVLVREDVGGVLVGGRSRKRRGSRRGSRRKSRQGGSKKGGALMCRDELLDRLEDY